MFVGFTFGLRPRYSGVPPSILTSDLSWISITASAVSEGNHGIDTRCSSRRQQACDGRGGEEYSSDDREDGDVTQTALGPTMDDIAEADAEQNAEDESHTGGSKG